LINVIKWLSGDLLMTETLRMSDNLEYEEAARTEAAELSRQMGRGALRLVEKAEPTPAAETNDGLETINYTVSAEQRAANRQNSKPRGMRRGL
jgi:predicted translin family RNA/ssDNA-binding protein